MEVCLDVSLLLVREVVVGDLFTVEQPGELWRGCLAVSHQ